MEHKYEQCHIDLDTFNERRVMLKSKFNWLPVDCLYTVCATTEQIVGSAICKYPSVLQQCERASGVWQIIWQTNVEYSKIRSESAFSNRKHDSRVSSQSFRCHEILCLEQINAHRNTKHDALNTKMCTYHHITMDDTKETWASNHHFHSIPRLKVFEWQRFGCAGFFI